jgi:hypothetical protein
MTDLFPAFVSPSPLHTSPVERFLRSPGSGRDSPRTLVAEEIIKLHISTPPIHQTEKPFILNPPKSKSRKRFSVVESLSSDPESAAAFTPAADPSLEMSPSKRRPPRPTPAVADDMDICDDSSLRPSRVHSPPPPLADSDSDSEMDDTRPADEQTRYLRRKKRAEQIAAYRMRELKEDRDLRCARRNNSLSLKASKITKQTAKKVKFEFKQGLDP